MNELTQTSPTFLMLSLIPHSLPIGKSIGKKEVLAILHLNNFPEPSST